MGRKHAKKLSIGAPTGEMENCEVLRTNLRHGKICCCEVAAGRSPIAFLALLGRSSRCIVHCEFVIALWGM